MARLGSLVVALLLGLLAAGAGAEAPGAASGSMLPAVLRAESEQVVRALLDGGSVVLDRGGDMVQSYVLFDRPLDRVYELLAATVRQKEYRSELEGITRVARLPDGHVDQHRIRILFVGVEYRLRYRVDPERKRISWELDPSFPTPMRRIQGSWDLFGMDPSRTLGRLSTVVDVGDAVPKFFEDVVTRGTLPRTLQRCRRWVNADGVAP